MMHPRRRIGRRVTGAAFALAIVAACASTDREQADPIDLRHQDRDEVARFFGPGADPDAVLARVDGDPIHVRDVALALSFVPDLTVEQVVDDLIDVRVASAAWRARADARDEGFDEAAAADALHVARQRARVLTWVAERVHRDASIEPADAEVRALAEDPTSRTLFGAPPLAVASHVLFHVPDDAPDALRDRARAFAAELHATARESSIADWARLSRLGATFEERATDAGLTLLMDAHITFPQRYAGPRTWQGVDAVVEPFADAAFALEPGSLTVPVDTVFGTHVILVEAFLPGTAPEGDALLDAARDRLRVQARVQAMNRLVATLGASVDVSFVPEAVQLLGLDSVQRAQAQQAMQAGSLPE